MYPCPKYNTGVGNLYRYSSSYVSFMIYQIMENDDEIVRSATCLLSIVIYLADKTVWLIHNSRQLIISCVLQYSGHTATHIPK